MQHLRGEGGELRGGEEGVIEERMIRVDTDMLTISDSMQPVTMYSSNLSLLAILLKSLFLPLSMVEAAALLGLMQGETPCNGCIVIGGVIHSSSITQAMYPTTPDARRLIRREAHAKGVLLLTA